jgi:molecular chaperone GrpE
MAEQTTKPQQPAAAEEPAAAEQPTAAEHAAAAEQPTAAEHSAAAEQPTDAQPASPQDTDEFTAAAPRHPGAAGTGETSFGDAEAPAAGEVKEAEAAVEDDAAKFLALAQRTQADFDNYRKRMARENAAAVDRGVGKLAKELLPALDHLDLALKASEGHTQSTSSTGTGQDVVKGFALVRDEIVNALGRVGIQPFAPEGEPFDPNEHEAMASQPSEDAESGTVIEVYQQGYRINGAVLRPARVVVAE